MLYQILGIPDREYVDSRSNARRAIRAGDAKSARAWLTIAERIQALEARHMQFTLAQSKLRVFGETLNAQEALRLFGRMRKPK